jgi:hypothetical protein
MLSFYKIDNMKKLASSLKKRKAAHHRGTKRSERIKSTKSEKSKRRAHFLTLKEHFSKKEKEARAEIEARRQR